MVVQEVVVLVAAAMVVFAMAMQLRYHDVNAARCYSVILLRFVALTAASVFSF